MIGVARVLILLTMFCGNLQGYQQSLWKTNVKQFESYQQVVEKKIFKEDNFLKIDVSIPEITGIDNKDKEALINHEITEWTDLWIKDVQDLVSKYFDEDKNLAPGVKYELTANYNVTKLNPLSFYINYYQYTGGAHGISTKTAYTIDDKTGKKLSLGDLFKKQYDYKSVINREIKKAIDKDPDSFFDGGKMFKGVDNKTKFYIDGDKLVIYYGEYEIAPYASGMPTFEIDKEIFGDNYIY